MKIPFLSKVAFGLGLSLTVWGGILSWNDWQAGSAPRRPASADAPYDPEQGTVELHAHLFMDEGLKRMFRGTFFSDTLRGDWSTRFSSQANPETVNKSQIAILVVSLYALPGNTNVKAAILREIADAERFVRENPQWIIARDPNEAKRALDAGKRVLVLSLESARYGLDNEDDIRELVDEKGIRIVTFMHLKDNNLGGAAYMRGFHAMSNPLSFIESFGAHLNPQRLEPYGKDILQRLLAHHVWIDLSHAAEATSEDMIPIIRAAGQPLLYTHAPLRKYYGSERGVTSEQVEQVRLSHGIIGVVPSNDMLLDTKVDPSHCPKECPCKESAIAAFAQQYTEMANLMGSADQVMIGSDFNGGIPHLSPSCGTGTSIDREGLWNIGQTGELWQALRALNAPVPPSPRGSREAFLRAWAQAMGVTLQ